uniref:Probable ubiquitin-like-specific protease 2A isoform X1 n=1 Tax=Tanacetum cinerariifolium TaxID=118510 RepID=A0A699H7W3_TANCI|nr:probable ubiquitin-like-specific protease 2A isoform X1 [Tanacetum cinerariifolium]
MSTQSQKWTTEEEDALLASVKKHGTGDWSIIRFDPEFASSLTNRTDDALRGKWQRSQGKSLDVSNNIKKVSTCRIDDLMHLPPHPTRKRSIIRRKKRVVEGISDFCGVVEEFSDSEGGVAEEVSDSEGGVVEEVSDSQGDVVEDVSEVQVCLSEELTGCQDYYHRGTNTRQKRGTRTNMVNQTRKLSSEKIHRYLENIWLSFPENKMSSFTHLDPLWYSMYSDDSNKEKVLNWIKKKDIFSRKYVLFPIVQWRHWSVVIFCHFGESLESKVKTPCILLLDSLEKADHSKQLEPLIRKFVLDIYRNLERTEDTKPLRKIPFLVPKVPQQRDGEECGFFALYYIKLFVESAPESFSISDGYPYFMTKDWFSFEGFDSFCKTLDSSDV